MGTHAGHSASLRGSVSEIPYGAAAATGEVYDHLASGAVGCCDSSCTRVNAQKLTCQRRWWTLYVLRGAIIDSRPTAGGARTAAEPEMVLPPPNMACGTYRQYCREEHRINCTSYRQRAVMKPWCWTPACAASCEMTCENDLDPTQFVWRPLKPTLTRSLYVQPADTGETALRESLESGRSSRVFKEKSERLSQAGYPCRDGGARARHAGAPPQAEYQNS